MKLAPYIFFLFLHMFPVSFDLKGNTSQAKSALHDSESQFTKLSNLQSPQNISSNVSVFEDKSSILSFDQIRKKIFIVNRKDNLYFPFTASTFWIKIKISNEKELENHCILEWDNALVEKIDFYNPIDDNTFNIIKMGAFVEKKFRILEYNPHISLSFKNKEEKTLYIKVQSHRGHNAELIIQSPSFYDRNYLKTTFISGFLSGLVFLRLFYVLLIGIFAVKEIAFRRYSFLLVMRSIAFWGIGSVLGGIFTDNPIKAAHINFLSYHALPIGQVLVVLAILPINKFHRSIKIILYAIIIITFFLGVIIAFDYHWMWLLASTYLIIFTLSLIIGLYIFAIVKKYSFNIFYSIPFLLGIGSYVFWQMRLVGWVDFFWIIPFATLCFVSEIFVFGIFLGRIIINYDRNKIISQKELLFNQNQTLRLQELTSLKAKFFTNISHEFRTPLTLILSPLNDLIIEFPQQQIFKIMHRNANRLLNLINQVLDLSKLEAKQMIPIIEQVELVCFFESITNSFNIQAENKKINFSVKQNEEYKWGFIDKDKVEKIVINLLSNAFKFTYEEKKINVIISYTSDNQYVKFEISDEGIGISEDNLPQIFQRFYQIHDSIKKDYIGTGIGLALVKELVEVLKGSMQVESELNIGTIFTVTLPIDKTFWENQTFQQSMDKDASVYGYVGDKLSKNHVVHTDTLESKGSNIILIVDDNDDIRDYLKTIFSSHYQITEAVDGKDGLEKAIQQIPDLIICDLMMPNIDGFEFCRRVKENEKTSHVPIIMLSARSAVESRIESFELGADEFLSKPFDSSEIKARVKGLILNREQLKKRYGKELVDLKPTEVKVASIDEQFLRKAKEVVEKNVSNTQFDVILFANEMNLSPVQLRRKLKALTNFTVVEFIRNYRLQKATILLSQNAGSISEIAYSVGFDSLTYFGRVFQDVYKMSPSEYKSLR